MGRSSTAKRRTQVTLLRPEADPETFTLAEGATLADLLRAADAGIRAPSIMIDGRPIEEVMKLTSGMTITLAPEPSDLSSSKPWRETIGMFAGDPDFEEAVEAGRAIREADRQSVGNHADRNDS